MDTWYAYCAGFMDGEGSICISRVKSTQYSDNHRLIIDIAQHTDRLSVLYDFQRDFGGQVAIKRQNRKSFTPDAHIANWHLQKRADVERFLRAILPYLRCKREQAELALAFLEVTAVKSKAMRTGGASGQRFWAGTERLTEDQIELREQFRLRMREANRLSSRPSPGEAAG